MGDKASIDADLTGAPCTAVAELLACRTTIAVGLAIIVENIAG